MSKNEHDVNLTPNPQRLDEEWVKQPELYRQWANELADAKREYAEAQNLVNEARHRVDVVSAVVEACDHKRRALENLVRLQLSSYYASPKAPEDAKDRMEEVEKQEIRGRHKRTK